VTALIHHEPMVFSLEGQLAKINISIPLKDFFHMLGQKEAVNWFVGSLTNFSNDQS
jgi:hypothetical protein